MTRRFFAELRNYAFQILQPPNLTIRAKMLRNNAHKSLHIITQPADSLISDQAKNEAGLTYPTLTSPALWIIDQV